MDLCKYDVMKCITQNGHADPHDIVKLTGYSLDAVSQATLRLVELDYLDSEFSLTEKAHKSLKFKKPKNAIILAAGFGRRMIPINMEVPKGLLEVQGEALIERLICQLHEVNIFDIDIVVGFLKEKYDYLIDKYGVNLVYNPDYALKNNIHSLAFAVDKISNTYILPCDIWAAENPFSNQELYSWYSISEKLSPNSKISLNPSKEIIINETAETGKGMLGIAYLLEEQAQDLRDSIRRYCADKKHDYSFWEEALFNPEKKITVYGKTYKSDQVIGINTYEDLRDLDDESSHLDTKIISLIANEMDMETKDIENITVLKKGMTNRSFIFSIKDKQYIMRIPGEGTDKLINRANEYKVYRKIKESNISDELIYMSPEKGYKITEFLHGARECDPSNLEDVRLCMEALKRFHKKKLKVSHTFDIYERIDFYESLWEGKPSIFKDYLETKENIMSLEEIIEEFPKEWILTHVDAVPDNFLLIGDKVRLIDWEYAGMQDPHVDIAMFAIYSLYDRGEVDQLIDIYFEGKCEHAVRIKIYAYIAMCGLLWSNWCEYKRFCGVEFGEYSLKQYRYAKDFYKIVKEEMENGVEI